MSTHVSQMGVFTVALALAGCSGGSSALTPAQSISSLAAPQGWPAARKDKPILFVADSAGNAVRLYDPNTPNPSPEATITDGISNPQGLAVDAAGALYVSNAGGAHEITVYSPGRSSPRLKIPGPGYDGIAVDSKGDIFATRFDGTVTEYQAGDKKPFKVIHGYSNPVGIAVDRKDNVWVADDKANVVSMVRAGSKKVENVGLKRLNGPFGIALGHNDTLYVSNYSQVNVYPRGSTVPSLVIKKGITESAFGGVTANDAFFQSNQYGSVVGYKKDAKRPFSTIVGNINPAGIAAWPLVKQ